MTVLYWFQNDLRLYDNPVLSAAATVTDDLIPVFILDDTITRPLGGAQRWWLHHSLTALINKLKKQGITLLLRKGNTQQILIELVQKYNVTAIYCHRSYEPAMLQYQQALQRYFAAQEIIMHLFKGYLLTEPSIVKNKSGNYFKVFTPYWKFVSTLITPTQLLPTPNKLSQRSKIVSESLASWQLLPTHPDWSHGFAIWQAGEDAGQQVLQHFIEHGLQNYAEDRDRPDRLGTSRLSPYLHFGEISVRQVWQVIKQAEIAVPGLQKGAQAFLRQLIWREFSYYLLWHFPLFYQKNFRAEFDKFPWLNNQSHLRAWQQGLTGYPIVDAGMRELWATGYLHNRVRMIVASFLTKHLLIHWCEGEKWFWDTLVDADLANNSAGWQWVAGSGADAAPYFRIFNPTLQGEKFDPNGEYVRKWVPELANLPNKYIHDPSQAPRDILTAAGIELGHSYPLPIVNHKIARETALKSYQACRKTNK